MPKSVLLVILSLALVAAACGIKPYRDMNIRQIDPQAALLKEASMGLHAPGFAAVTSNIDLPSKAKLMAPSQLSIGSCDGELLDQAALKKAALKELADRLGGVFKLDLARFMTVHSSLVSADALKQYEAPGISVTIDKPEKGFVYLAVELDGWQLYILGEQNQYYAIFLGQALAHGTEMPLSEGTMNAELARVQSKLVEFFPKIEIPTSSNQADLSAKDSPWWRTWQQDQTEVKVGMRKWMRDEMSLEEKYFVGARMNWVLP